MNSYAILKRYADEVDESMDDETKDTIIGAMTAAGAILNASYGLVSVPTGVEATAENDHARGFSVKIRQRRDYCYCKRGRTATTEPRRVYCYGSGTRGERRSDTFCDCLSASASLCQEKSDL